MFFYPYLCKDFKAPYYFDIIFAHCPTMDNKQTTTFA